MMGPCHHAFECVARARFEQTPLESYWLSLVERQTNVRDSQSRVSTSMWTANFSRILCLRKESFSLSENLFRICVRVSTNWNLFSLVSLQNSPKRKRHLFTCLKLSSFLVQSTPKMVLELWLIAFWWPFVLPICWIQKWVQDFTLISLVLSLSSKGICGNDLEWLKFCDFSHHAHTTITIESITWSTKRSYWWQPLLT